MWILIDNGDIFEGDAEQFNECFGIVSNPESVADFATALNVGWKIYDLAPLCSHVRLNEYHTEDCFK